jgi:hypothetical protein
LDFGGSKLPIAMQKILTITCASLFFVLSSFTTIKGLDDVITAMNGGNATEMSRYVDDNISIALPDKTGTYSKTQGIMILRDFFANNSVRSFEVRHKGDNSGNQFCIGVLHTRSGDYRTTVFMKTKNGRQVMKEIRFQSV